MSVTTGARVYGIDCVTVHCHTRVGFKPVVILWYMAGLARLKRLQGFLWWLAGKRLRVVIVAMLALLFPFGAWAQEPAPTPAPPCDPAKTACLTVEGWVLGQRTWSMDAEPRDLPGARLQAEAHFAGRWRVAVRGDATGSVGEFQRDKPETYKAVEGYLAGAYDALTIPSLASVGPAAVIGAGLSLETKDGARPQLPKSMTAGIGARVSWRAGWAYVVVGQHASLRGVAVMGTWQVRLSDRVANIGTVAIGSRAYIATIGVGVRFL